MIKKLDQWIFGFGSPLTMGVYRAVFGSLIFVNLLLVAIDFPTWYTERGLAPAKMATIWAGAMWRVNVLEGVTDPNLTLAVYGIVVVAALMTALGLFTRVASIILAVGIVSLHHRDPFILNGGDTLLRVTAIYLAIAPSGAAFSLDRLRAIARNKPVPDEVSLWPQRLIQVQMALMYGTTVWHKLTGVHWFDGTAAWYPPQLIEFHRFPMPAWIDLPPILQLETWGTLVIEVALASLVFWRPARKWVLLGGVALHAMIEYRFNIPMFAFLSVAQYISHYESSEVASWLARTKAKIVKSEVRSATS